MGLLFDMGCLHGSPLRPPSCTIVIIVNDGLVSKKGGKKVSRLQIVKKEKKLTGSFICRTDLLLRLICTRDCSDFNLE